jgi:hypothetical protein
MSKHTPGPWEIDPSESRGSGGERVFKVCAGRVGGGGLIADVSAWWVDTWSAQVNARLIAEAPAMVEALRACASRLGEMDCGPEWEEAHAVLRRIEGEGQEGEE